MLNNLYNDKLYSGMTGAQSPTAVQNQIGTGTQSSAPLTPAGGGGSAPNPFSDIISHGGKAPPSPAYNELGGGAGDISQLGGYGLSIGGGAPRMGPPDAAAPGGRMDGAPAPPDPAMPAAPATGGRTRAVAPTPPLASSGGAVKAPPGPFDGNVAFPGSQQNTVPKPADPNDLIGMAAHYRGFAFQNPAFANITPEDIGNYRMLAISGQLPAGTDFAKWYLSQAGSMPRTWQPPPPQQQQPPPDGQPGPPSTQPSPISVPGGQQQQPPPDAGATGPGGAPGAPGGYMGDVYSMLKQFFGSAGGPVQMPDLPGPQLPQGPQGPEYHELGVQPYLDQLKAGLSSSYNSIADQQMSKLRAEAARNGSLNSGGYGMQQGRLLGDLGAQQSKELSTTLLDAYNQQQGRSLQQYLGNNANRTQMYGQQLGYLGDQANNMRGLYGSLYGANRGAQSSALSSMAGLAGSQYGNELGLTGTKYAADRGLQGAEAHAGATQAAANASLQGQLAGIAQQDKDSQRQWDQYWGGLGVTARGQDYNFLGNILSGLGNFSPEQINGNMVNPSLFPNFSYFPGIDWSKFLGGGAKP